MEPMAKAPKDTINPDSKPLQSTPDDWMPLADAFLHIQQVVGGEQLAEEDLRLRLVSGDVEVQDRWVTPGEGIDAISLTPEDFKPPYGLLFYRAPELNSYNIAHIGFLRRVERYRLDGHNFFLRHVYRTWPIAGDTEKPQQAALPMKRPTGLGHKAWLAAQEVYKLRRAGGKWINIEHDLLGQIRKRLGGDEWVSEGTLKTAVAYLRRKRLIDL
jgi:hypothetical protein